MKEIDGKNTCQALRFNQILLWARKKRPGKTPKRDNHESQLDKSPLDEVLEKGDAEQSMK